jgi:hypothetical protein
MLHILENRLDGLEDFVGGRSGGNGSDKALRLKVLQKDEGAVHQAIIGRGKRPFASK